MKKFHPPIAQTLLLLFILIMLSCSKDSDLLSEFAILEDGKEINEFSSDSENAENSESDESDEEAENAENNSESTEPDPISNEEDNPPVTGNKAQAVNLQVYGVVGDGVTDDSNAIQAALDSGNDLIADPNSTFLVSRELVADTPGDQFVYWENSQIIVSTQDIRVFNVDKPSGLMSMENLTIDGNKLAYAGLIAESPVNLFNIDTKYLMNFSNTAYAILIRINGGGNTGDSIVDGCDCMDVDSAVNDNKIGNTKGAARCYQVVWSGSFPANPVTVTMKNATLTDVYAEDGDVLSVIDGPGGVGLTNNRVIFKNLVIQNWGRRAMKGLSGGIVFKDCTFNVTNANDPRLHNSSNLGPSGIIAFGNNVQNQRAENVVIDGCTFNGNGAGYQDSWNLVIFGRANNGKIVNSTLNNACDLAYYQYPGDMEICNVHFGPKSYLYDYNIYDIEGTLKIGSNVTYIEPTWNRLDSYGSSSHPGTLAYDNINCQ